MPDTAVSFAKAIASRWDPKCAYRFKKIRLTNSIVSLLISTLFQINALSLVYNTAVDVLCKPLLHSVI